MQGIDKSTQRTGIYVLYLKQCKKYRHKYRHDVVSVYFESQCHFKRIYGEVPRSIVAIGHVLS